MDTTLTYLGLSLSSSRSIRFGSRDPSEKVAVRLGYATEMKLIVRTWEKAVQGLDNM